MKTTKSFLGKIIIAIIITFVTTIMFCLHSIAYDIGSFMDIHNGTGTYLQSSEETKKGHLGKSVGYPPGSNDYAYVISNNRVWCMSEKQINKIGSPFKILRNCRSWR